jgi:hypothetical protein
MRYLSRRQLIALWSGIVAALLVMAFPPPLGDAPWPQFAFAESCDYLDLYDFKFDRCGSYRVWQLGEGTNPYLHRIEVPILAILLVTGAAVFSLTLKKPE